MCKKKYVTAKQLVITNMLRTDTCETARFHGTKDLSQNYFLFNLLRKKIYFKEKTGT